MSGDHLNHALTHLREQQRRPELGPPSIRGYALLDELRFLRREAQAEANLAYDDWCRDLCRDSYTVYRAAQDRADAAQDKLAECTRQLAARPLHSESR